MPPVSQLNTDIVHHKVTVFVGCVMAQAFSCCCLTTQTWVQSQASLCQIHGEKSGTGMGFGGLNFSHQYYFTNDPYSFTYHQWYIITAIESAHLKICVYCYAYCAWKWLTDRSQYCMGIIDVKSYPLQIRLHVKTMWFRYDQGSKQYQMVYLWEI